MVESQQVAGKQSIRNAKSSRKTRTQSRETQVGSEILRGRWFDSTPPYSMVIHWIFGSTREFLLLRLFSQVAER